MSYVIQHEGEEFEFEDNVPPQKAKSFVMKKLGIQPAPKVTGKQIMDNATQSVFSQLDRGQKVQKAGVALGKSGYMNTLAGLMTVGKNLDPVRYVNSKLPFQASKDYVSNQDAAVQSVQNKSQEYVNEAETSKPENMDVIDNVAMGGIDMLVQTPKYIASNIAGPVLGFSALSGVDAVGQGKEGIDVAKEAVKGAITGKVFKKTEGMNRLVKPVVLGSTMAGMTAMEGGSKEDVQTAFASGAVLGLMGGKKAKEQQKNLMKKAELKSDELRRGVRQFIPEKQNAYSTAQAEPFQEKIYTNQTVSNNNTNLEFAKELGIKTGGRRVFTPTEQNAAFSYNTNPNRKVVSTARVGDFVEQKPTEYKQATTQTKLKDRVNEINQNKVFKGRSNEILQIQREAANNSISLLKLKNGNYFLKDSSGKSVRKGITDKWNDVMPANTKDLITPATTEKSRIENIAYIAKQSNGKLAALSEMGNKNVLGAVKDIESGNYQTLRSQELLSKIGKEIDNGVIGISVGNGEVKGISPSEILSSKVREFSKKESINSYSAKATENAGNVSVKSPKEQLIEYQYPDTRFAEGINKTKRIEQPYPDQYSYKLTKDFETRVNNQKSITPQDVFEVKDVADFDQKMSNYVFGSEKIKPDPTQPRTPNFFARFTDALGEKVNQKISNYKSSGKLGAGTIDFFSQRLGRSQELIIKGDEFRGGKDYSLNVASNLKEKINTGLDPFAKKQISKVLRGEAKPEALPKDWRSKYEEIRSLNDSIHETNYGANGIRASQVKRLYQTGEITETQYKGRMKEIQGIYNANKGKYYANMYEPYELTDSPQHTGGKGMNTNMYKSRKDIPKEWKDANVINDPGFITAKRVLDTYMNVEYYKYADYIHKQSNMWSATPRKGYIQIPESNSYGLLAGKYVRSDSARDILGFVSSVDSLNALYKSLQIINVPRQYIKAGKTVLNPGVWAGNDISNRFFALASGAPEISIPGNKWSKFASEQMKSNGVYYRDLQKSGVIGTDFAKQEFKYDVNSALSDSNKGVFSKTYNKASKMYGDIDNKHKIAAYKYWLDKGMTRDQAIAKVKASYQDYSRVSWAWDVGSKLPIIGKPFAKFTPELIRILTNSAKQNPLWTMAIAGSLYALNEYTSNQFETPEQRNIRESDPRSSKIFGSIPTTFMTPWGEVDIRRWVMMNQLTQVNEKTKSDNLLARAGVPDVLNFTDTNGDVMLSPLLQVAQNENYIGKPIWKDAGERGIDAVGKVATHLADSYLPVPITPNSLNKISSAMTTNEGNLNTNPLDAGTPDRFGKRRTPAQVALEVGAGLRFRTMKDEDLKEIQDRVSMDLQNDTTNRIKQINSYMYQRGVSEEDKVNFLNNAIEYAKNDYAKDPEKQALVVASVKEAGENSLLSFKADDVYQKIKDKPIKDKFDMWASYISKDKKVAQKLLAKIKSNMLGKSSMDETIGKQKPEVQAAYLEFKLSDKTPEEQQKIIGDLLSRNVISKSAFKRYIERSVGL